MGADLSLQMAGTGTCRLTGGGGDASGATSAIYSVPNDASSSSNDGTTLPGGKYIIELRTSQSGGGGGTASSLGESSSSPLGGISDADVMSERFSLQQRLLGTSRLVGAARSMTEYQRFEELVNKWMVAKNSSQLKKDMESSLLSHFVKEQTTLVFEISGLERICTEEGLLHGLSLIKTMQSLCVPLIEENDGSIVKVVHDVHFCTFSDAIAAVEAACALMEITSAYSEGRTPTNSLRLSIGISMGPAWVIPGTDIFGDIPNLAFALTRDVANEEICVTTSVKEQIEIADPKKLLYTVLPCNVSNGSGTGDGEGNATVDTGADEEGKGTIVNQDDKSGGTSTSKLGISWNVCRRKKNAVHVPRVALPVVHASINASEPAVFAKDMAVRVQLQTRKEQEAMDYKIKSRFMRKRCVFVASIRGHKRKANELAKGNTEIGSLKYIELVMRMKAIVRDAILLYQGTPITAWVTKMVGQVPAVFPSCSDALECTITCYDKLQKLGADVSFALVYGDVLDLNGANIFGESVNNAFALAATGGDDENLERSNREILFDEAVQANFTRDAPMESKSTTRQVFGNARKVYELVWESKKALSMKLKRVTATRELIEDTWKTTHTKKDLDVEKTEFSESGEYTTRQSMRKLVDK
eukprot:g1587.t1